jgi:hypothetical protein
MSAIAGSLTARRALLVSLAIMWANYALTARWAQVVGSVRGPKQPLFLVVLLFATALTVAGSPRVLRGRVRPEMAVFAAGTALLLGSVLVWFPPGTWTQYPLLDNWPARYQATIDGLALFKQGVAAGWNWQFLGGYHASSDLTVALSFLAAIPVALLGPAVGFHALHLLLLVALPALVWIDLRLQPEDRPLAPLAAGLTAFAVASWFSYFMLRSGDTNSLAGTVCVVAALIGSHAAALGRRWGGWLLVAALVAVNYSHAGFFLYAAILLVVDALLARDWRRAGRAGAALAAGAAAALPLTWEAYRYRSYMIFNNVVFDPAPFALEPFLRKIYYNAEILFRPGRWFNDFAGLTNLLLPVIAWSAWRLRGRVRFYAWAALVTVGLTCFNTPELGYAFLRPVHLLVVLTPVVLAGFLQREMADGLLTAAASVLVAVYLQVNWMAVPHVPDLRAAAPALVDRLRSLDADGMILLENTFHRDMDAGPGQSQAPPFPAHVEGYLAHATGRRFFAGVWDGWQWSPFRVHLLSGGAFEGRAIDQWPEGRVLGELAHWGIRHVLVWSAASNAFFAAQPDVILRWRDGPWSGYDVLSADGKSATATHGQAALTSWNPLDAAVTLTDVRAGDRVVVRTNYFPAWTAAVGRQRVALYEVDGQLAFDAPQSGSYAVALQYPRRRWLLVVAAFGVIAGLMAVTVGPLRAS